LEQNEGSLSSSGTIADRKTAIHCLATQRFDKKRGRFSSPSLEVGHNEEEVWSTEEFMVSPFAKRYLDFHVSGTADDSHHHGVFLGVYWLFIDTDFYS
jgi:hypothetical protein